MRSFGRGYLEEGRRSKKIYDAELIFSPPLPSHSQKTHPIIGFL